MPFDKYHKQENPTEDFRRLAYNKINMQFQASDFTISQLDPILDIRFASRSTQSVHFALKVIKNHKMSYKDKKYAILLNESYYNGYMRMVRQCPEIPFILFVYVIEGYKLIGRKLDDNGMYIRQFPLKADPSKKIVLILEDSFTPLDDLFKDNKLNLKTKKINPHQRNLSDF